MATRVLCLLALAAAVIGVGLALPPAEPSVRAKLWGDANDGRRGGEGELGRLAKDVRGGKPKVHTLETDGGRDVKPEPRQSEVDNRDETSEHRGTELDAREGSRKSETSGASVKAESQEDRRPETDGMKQVEPHGPASDVTEKKPISTKSNRYAKGSKPVLRSDSVEASRVQPEQRDGSPIKPRTKPQIRSKPELRPSDGADLLTRKLYTLPNGKHALKSDNYPNDYAVGKKSYWTLVSAAGGTGSLTITCSDFLLEDGVSDEEEPCQYDFLSINGMRYCGSDAPHVTASRLQIEFHSDDTVTTRGFSCEVEVKDSCCGRVGAGRIVGGAEVAPHSLPWQVALSSPAAPEFVFCGGSVINSLYVVTAAHCTDGNTAAGFIVTVGMHNRRGTAGARRIKVAAIYQHAAYSSSTMDRDISLLKLAEELVFSSSVRPACLPRGGDLYSDVDAIVSGWGALRSNASGPEVLHSVTVHTMTNTQCEQGYGAGRITQNMLCAAGAGKDSCQGDSGGPLVTQKDGRFTQVGVVSFGVGCADPDHPGVYVRLSKMLDWLDFESADGQGC